LQEHEAQLKQERDKALQEGLRRGSQAEEEKAKIFSVTVRPYIEERHNSGFFSKRHIFGVGYQYQLLVNGIPCFEPHVVLEQILEERQVDSDRIERLAKELTRAAVALKAGPAAAAAISLDETPVKAKSIK
jgi:hypothetical protein